RFTLQLTGAGSQTYGWGTLGLRYWLRGNGGPGTLILDSGVGGVFLNDSCWSISQDTSACSRSVLYNAAASSAGPMASIGLDARF
ncbi:MAG TPA: hypothetical protein PKI03_32735, partial [Pseudomonadota bacterium]|nr:hypothetical protein [Pseudomonadota bacterium]